MTILGQHTVAEVGDLLANFDAQIAWLQKCRDAAAADDSWATANAVEWAKWLQDEAAFENAYNAAASAGVRDTVKITPSAIASDTPLEGPYQKILTAWQNSASAPSPGGFDDLVRRATTGPAAKDFGGQPAGVQPTAGDPDLQAYQAADAGVQAVQNAGQAVGQAVKTSVLSPTGLVVLLGLGVGAVVAVKVIK